MSTEQAMKQKPVVTWKGWLALLIMCCMFSGLFTGFEGALKPLNVLDFNTMVGSFGVDADGVNFQGKNGTGLGLYMSYSPTRPHFNGNISFESEERKRTSFIITLPIN